MAENLRQLCLWRYVTEVASQPTLWFDYVSAFDARCAASTSTWTDDCSYAQMDALGISSTFVRVCAIDAGTTDYIGGKNSLLDAELARRFDEGVFTQPVIVINQDPYEGTLSCPSPVSAAHCPVFQAVCSGYIPGSEPEPCRSNCALGEKRDPCNVCLAPTSPQWGQSCVGSSTPATFPIWATIVFVLGAVSVVGGIIYACMRKQNKQLKDDIDSLLKQYMPLDSAPMVENAGPVYLDRVRDRLVEETGSEF